jgi:predicted RecB family nuclease
MEPKKPQGSYFAKRCPERVQLDVLRPCEPLEDSLLMQQLAAKGNEFEADIFDEMAEGIFGAEVVERDPDDRPAWERATMSALSSGASIVVGGRLPADTAGRRTGEPDLLVHAAGPETPPTSPADGYYPIDVKSHKALDILASEGDGVGTALVSEVTTPWKCEATVDPTAMARWRTNDLLQLAHYRRMLESAGMAAEDGNYGGILGSEGVVVWYDLDEPRFTPSEYLEDVPERLLSAMELYDLEFSHRLTVFDAATAHRADSTTELQAEPIDVPECPNCRWREWCGLQLEESADVSLLPRVTVSRRRTYHQHGVADLHDLSILDPPTAHLVRDKVDLEDLLVKAASMNGDVPLATVIPNRRKQLERLASHGIVTVSDLVMVDPLTLSLGSEVGDLLGQIDLARARVGPSGAYRRRGVARIEVPRADIEVDVDMENVADGCYLWGALITDWRAPKPTPTYRPFAYWGDDLALGETLAFTDFWTWMKDERRAAKKAGASFRAYCYNEGAENGQMTRIADGIGLRAEVDAFIASEEWVDLLRIVRTHLITGHGLGLKFVAPLAGFAWRSDDVGGDLAMVRFEEAIDDADPDLQAAAQQWILDYNEDDCAATAALREWLDAHADTLPSITDFTPTRRSHG